MNVDKVKAAIEAAKKATQELINSTAVNASKEPHAVKGIGKLVEVGEKLEQASAKLDDAVEKATPKVKEEKEGKKGDKK